MKYGISVSTFPTRQRPATFGDGDPARHLDALRRLGYDGVDLFHKPMPDAYLERLRRSLAETGMCVSVLFPVVVFEDGWCLSDPDPGRRREAVRLFDSQTDVAGLLGAKIVLGLDRGRPIDGEPFAVFEDRLAESLVVIAAHAERAGVAIVLEPIHRFLPVAFQRVDQCLDFLDRRRLGAVQLLLDTFHMNIEERSFEEAIRLAGRRIGHVHVVENNRGAPGEGHLPLREIVRSIVATGYDGYLSVETEPRDEPLEVAERAIAVLRGIVSGLQKEHQL
jgi:sugar phosphate isomerase/epimerase